MKIALVTYALQIGGVETFLQRIARCFQEQFHDVCFVETYQKGRWSDAFEQQGFRVARLLPQPMRSSLHHARVIAQFLAGFDLVILNDAPRAQAGISLLPRHIVVLPVLHMYLTSMVRNAASNATSWDALVTVCPAGAESAVRFGVDPQMISVIPNGVEILPQYHKSREVGDLPLKIGYIGAINHSQKGVLYLPNVARLLHENGTNFTLDVVGSGPDEGVLAQGFSSLPGIVMHGPLANEQVMQMLTQLDILLMPSHFEGLPLVLLEAMSLGVVPVVSWLKGCTDFAVTDGKDGFLVKVGDVTGFAAAIAQLAENRDLLWKMSFAAWETVSKRFASENTAEAYLTLAQRCLDARNAGRGPARNGKIDLSLLGDFPRVPLFTVRPVRKLLRMLKLFPQGQAEPLLFKP